MLDKPQYKRLVLGSLEGQKPTIHVAQASDAISDVPYAEPMAFAPGYYSPFYSESHRKFHRAVRRFANEVVKPEAQAREEDGKKIGQAVVDKMAYVYGACGERAGCADTVMRRAVGWLHMRLGPGKHLKGVNILDGVIKPEEVCRASFRFIYCVLTYELSLTTSTRCAVNRHGKTTIADPVQLIYHQETCRFGTRAFNDGMLVSCFLRDVRFFMHWPGQLSGLTIGLPPVLNYANNAELKTRVCDEVLSGKKYISLAITEAFAGSDVAGLQTTAVKTEDGKFWIVNGTKK